MNKLRHENNSPKIGAGKLFLTPMSVFRKNIIVSHSAQIISVVCNFICTILAARMLGKSGQGELSLYVSFSAFVLLVTGLGLPSAIVYFTASQKIKKGKIIPLILSVTITMMLLFVVVFFTAKKFNLLNVFIPDFLLQNSFWCYVLVLHVLLQMLNQFMLTLFQADNQFTKAGIITASGSIGLLIAYSIKFFSTGDIAAFSSLYWIAGSMLLVGGLQYFLTIAMLYKADKNYFSFLPFSFQEVKPLFAFSLLAYLANIVQFLNYKMDLWFINYFHQSKEMIGVYALAASLAQLVWLLPNAVHAVLYTYVSSDMFSIEEKKAKTSKTSSLILLYSLVCGVAGYLLSIYLVPVLFGKEFIESVHLIGILLIGIVPFTFGMGLSAYFAGMQKISVNLQGSVIGLVVCLTLDFFLIPEYEIEGAAWASVISYVATTLYYFFSFKKTYKLSPGLKK